MSKAQELLSHRLTPGTDCHYWVIEEVRRLEAENAALREAKDELLEALTELLHRSENFHAANVYFKDFAVAQDAMEKARAAIQKHGGGA